MPMRRFYCPHLHLDSSEIIIDDLNERHHLLDVLRFQVGQELVLFNGQGLEAQGEIMAITASNIQVRLVSCQEILRGHPPIILACAVPKRSKFEIIVEKATEMGVDEIIPLHTERTEVVWPAARMKKKRERYTQVAMSAAKQSQRTRLPVIHAMMSFKQALEDAKGRSTILIPSLSGEPQPLLPVLTSIDAEQSISLFIGPEGDFTPQEYAAAQKAGAQAVSLGPTVLRVETAALCVLAGIHLHYSSL